MKTLLLLRHAKSSWAEPDLADVDRPLNKRGKRAALRMGELLRDQALVPGWILASTALRARDTAARVAEACGFDGTPNLQPELYLAPPQTCLDALADVPNDVERVLLVAHNPGLELLVSSLGGAYEDFPTAALAVLTLKLNAWCDAPGVTPATAELVHLWRPRELDAQT